MRALIAILLAMVLKETISRKPYRLKILNIVDDEALVTYRHIAQLAADVVNNRSDILSDYHVEMQFEDEYYGNVAAEKLINFHRQRENTSLDYYQSPIMIGPAFSPGCKAICTVLEHVDMVAQTSGCGAPDLWNHALYHNLYLMTNTAYHLVLGVLQLVKSIGWNRFAVFTYGANPIDYGSAILLHQKALENGMVVPWISMVMNLEETGDEILSLKTSNPRVIVITTTTEFVLYRFLCEAYKVGIKGPRYPFIAMSSGLAEPFDTPVSYFPGCTRSEIFEQLRQTLFGDNAVNLQNSTWRSEFGQSQAEFDLYVQHAAKLSRPAEDPYRYLYYDSQVKTILALHNAEEQLKRQNLSLRDFARFPQLVMETANSSLLHTNLSGLHIKSMRYSKAGLPEEEGIVASQWSPELGLRGFVLGKTIDEKIEMSSWEIHYFAKINWTTTNGERPRDDYSLLRKTRTVPQGVFVSVVVIAAALVLFKVTVMAIPHMLMRIRHWVPRSEMFGHFGCILVDAATICLVSPDHGYSTTVAAITLLTLGLAMSHGTLAMRGVAMRTIPQITPTNNAQMRRVSQVSIRMRRRARAMGWRSFEKVATFGTIIFVFFNAFFLICWLAIDPIKCSSDLFETPLYVEKDDLLIENYVQICATHQMIAWSISLAFLHAVLLAMGGWLVYLGRRQHRRRFPEYPYIRFGITNALTLLLGVLLVIIVLREPVGELIAIAYGALTNSAISSLGWFLGSIKKGRAVHAHVAPH